MLSVHDLVVQAIDDLKNNGDLLVVDDSLLAIFLRFWMKWSA